MAISAILVGGQVPQLVQITVSQTGNNLPYTITGSAGGTTWIVPGGDAIGTGGPATVVDNRTPLGVPITYTYTPLRSGNPQVAAPVTVASPYDLVVQALDGQNSVGFDMLDGSGAIELAPMNAVFNVPNRPRPVIRYAMTGDGGGELRIGADMSSTAAFRALLRSGAPMLIRRQVMADDLPLVFVALLMSVGSKEFAYDISYREWVVPFLYVDDPFLDVVLAAFSWDTGFDAVLAGRSWDTFDTNFSARSWNEFSTIDWTTV